MSRDSVIWKVKPPFKQKPSILAGSMHLNSDAAYEHIEKLKYHIDQYDYIAFEINMLEGKVEIDDFIMPEKLSLNNYLTDSQIKKVKKLLETEFGFPYEMCNKLYPLFTVNILTQILLNKGDRQFLDEYLWSYALQSGKQLFGLEDIDEHYDLLKNIQFSYQLSTFKDFIFNLSGVREEYKKLSDLYSDSKIHAIYKKTKKSLGKIREPMLYRRNQLIVDEIRNFNEEENAFMAIVGASHMSGENGILHYLRKHQYKITPLED